MRFKDCFYSRGNTLVKNTQWYHSLWGGATKFWDTSQFNIDVVNLGSNPGLYDFCYEGLPLIGKNWALGPQSLVHDYNILKNYFSFLREGATVLIVVCPFSCLFSSYNKEHNFKYYTFLHPATICNFIESERTRAWHFKEIPFNKEPWMCLKHILKEKLQNKLRTNKISPMQNNIAKTAEDLVSGWKKQFGIDDLCAPLSLKHREEFVSRRGTLNDMIFFCHERLLKPVIIVPPMHRSLRSLLPDDFKKHYVDDFLMGLDASILDYMDNNFRDMNYYFDTALFLNKKGAKLFTKQVLSDIGLLK